MHTLASGGFFIPAQPRKLQDPLFNFLYIWPSIYIAVRQLLSFILVGLVSFQSTGYLVLPMVRLGAARSRSVKTLREEGDELILLISRAEFESCRSGKREFWRDGVLYDIISIRPEGNSIRVTACADRHEQALLQGIQQMFQYPEGTSNGNPLPRLLAQLLTAPYMQAGIAWVLRHPRVAEYHINFLSPFFPDSREPEICSPPPETV